VNTKHSNVAKADKKLQDQLRKHIAEKGIRQVVAAMQIGPDSIRSYLADLPMRPSTFRGIEATIAGGHLQEAQGGLRR
jgi:hypothetical protein